ncbi:hypothetical protein FD723_34105 (plasmid) [Nostoc sp. C052]|uniref:hypothetical protein n=1 Tax=Nostoc sp. C052 TaxID=2576902 RepID=UPI0015C2EA4A|nr:hypothetical protein [Nostoc sp. C052]QLE45339.1 hypothetical protein FD723_34105 [Nostoc sp. C052]
MMAEHPLDSDRQLLGHDIEGDQLRHRSFSYFLSSLLRLRQRDAIRERLYSAQMLVVSQPKIAGWRSAEEQGSRGAEERFVQVLSPLPLRTSASLLATTLALPWQTTRAIAYCQRILFFG